MRDRPLPVARSCWRSRMGARGGELNFWISWGHCDPSAGRQHFHLKDTSHLSGVSQTVLPTLGSRCASRRLGPVSTNPAPKRGLLFKAQSVRRIRNFGSRNQRFQNWDGDPVRPEQGCRRRIQAMSRLELAQRANVKRGICRLRPFHSLVYGRRGWALGAVASATALHAAGRGFESLSAHHFLPSASVTFPSYW